VGFNAGAAGDPRRRVPSIWEFLQAREALGFVTVAEGQQDLQFDVSRGFVSHRPGEFLRIYDQNSCVTQSCAM
jgi:hypothetical protein